MEHLFFLKYNLKEDHNKVNCVSAVEKMRNVHTVKSLFGLSCHPITSLLAEVSRGDKLKRFSLSRRERPLLAGNP